MNKLLIIACALSLAGCGFDDDKKSASGSDDSSKTSGGVNPLKPIDPMKPFTPLKPTMPINPADPTQADKPNNPKAPDQPDDPKDPAEPYDPKDVDIVGIWDRTRDLGSRGVDEFYIAIDSDGNVSTYDYDGDTYDRGHNCYFIEKDIIQIEGYDDYYQFTYAYTDETLDVEITLEDGQLNFTSLEDSDELKFSAGETRTFGTTTSDLDVEDFENLACEYK